jgi:hypothetical protein
VRGVPGRRVPGRTAARTPHPVNKAVSRRRVVTMVRPWLTVGGHRPVKSPGSSRLSSTISHVRAWGSFDHARNSVAACSVSLSSMPVTRAWASANPVRTAVREVAVIQTRHG